MQVNVRPLVFDKLEQLLRVLLEECYFATEEKALAYVKELRLKIESVYRLQHYPTKDTSFGHYYASFKPNRNTTWYILFDKKGERYIVRNLINNHTPDYPKFITGLK